MTIDAVVFDLGQVLVRWDPRRVWQGRRSEAQIEEFLREFAVLNSQLDAGRTFDSAITALGERDLAHAEMLREYRERFASSLLGPVPGMARIVGALKEGGLRVLGLTNWSAETFHHAEPAAPAIGELESIVVSGKVGLAKPDPAIFALLIDRFGLTPESTVFIDDSERNVSAARAAGLHAIGFHDAEQLRRELRQLGVAVLDD